MARRPQPTDERRRLLALEKNLVQRSHVGGDYRVHLVYPNSYWVAMSNLGFQAVYNICATTPGIDVDRGFLPENHGEIARERWRSFEHNRPLDDCQMLAFSISFETDYPHIVAILKNAGVLSLSPEEREHRADESRFGAPLIVGGGTSATLNPEPIADLFDVIVLGEAEEVLPELLAVVQRARAQGMNRRETLIAAAHIEGVYVPRFYSARYDDQERIVGFDHDPAVPPRPLRRYVRDLGKFPTHTRILTPETEFKSMFMTETGRGCEMGCRFCVAGYIYRPVRKRPEDTVLKTVEEGISQSDSVGFVGASVSSHRAIGKLTQLVARSGKRASLSSLMAQKITPELAESISESEYKTVALAPEAGTDRLRFATGKRVKSEVFISAARELAQRGVRGFKLYFIIGLPTETEEDVQGIPALAAAVRDAVVDASRSSGKPAWVQISLNPFIPKAVTPFQWEPMLPHAELEARVALVKGALRREAAIELRHESPRESVFQCILSRGDRRVAQALVIAAEEGRDWKWLVATADQRLDDAVPPLRFFVERRIPFDEVLPWDVIDPRVDKSLLEREARRAHATTTAEVDGVDGEEDPDLVRRAVTG